MATRYTLDNIRKSIERHLGKEIILKANKGRKKIVTKRGFIEDTYPNIFVVKVLNHANIYTRVSYSYSDVLTSNVKLKLVSNRK